MIARADANDLVLLKAATQRVPQPATEVLDVQFRGQVLPRREGEAGSRPEAFRFQLMQKRAQLPDVIHGRPLADALPDAFGTQVIRAYYTARGETAKALSPVQHLLYVGTRGIGALEFHPAEAIPARPRETEALEIQALVADARRILAGDPDVTIPEIYRIGSSAGGIG